MMKAAQLQLIEGSFFFFLLKGWGGVGKKLLQTVSCNLLGCENGLNLVGEKQTWALLLPCNKLHQTGQFYIHQKKCMKNLT